MSIKIIDELEPKGAGGFPLLDDEHLRGSLRQVSDTSARDAIPSGHRKEGMFVFTQADQTLWVLQSDLTTWVEYISPVDVTGTPAVGDLVEVAEGASPFVSARAMVTDGSNLYIGQSGQGGLNSPVVWQVKLSGSAVVSSSSVDLSSSYPLVGRVRDLSIDGSYLYAATWTAGHVAIIDISTMAVAGWAYVGSAGSQVTSVTTDGIGNIYAVGYDAGAGSPAVWKWSLASCLGQPPETAGPSAFITGLGWRRFIRAGGGKLWVSNGDGGTPLVLRIDPTTMTIDGYIDSIDTFTNVDVMTMLYLSPSSLCLVGDFDGNPVILSVNPNDPEWTASHLITGFLAAQPPPPFYRSIANIVLGPDASGTPNQWLWVCETSYNASSGPRVGALDRNTFMWQGTITLNANDNAVYEGIAAIGDYVFFARYKGQDAPAVVSTIDYRNPVSATTGSLTGLSPKFLQYASIGGDVSGTASSLTVAGLQGQPVSSSVPGSAGDLLTWDGSQWASASPPPASGTAGGDLSGSYPNPTVAQINGYSASAVPTTAGELMTWDGSSWVAQSAPGASGTAGGDLSGTYPDPSVSKINGYSVTAAPTTNGDVLTWDTGTSAWVAQAASGGGDPATPQTGNNYAPVKVDSLGAAVQSWINLNGGTGYRSGLVDGDVSGVVQQKMVGGMPGLQGKFAGYNLKHKFETEELLSGDGLTSPLKVGRYPVITSGSFPKSISINTTTGRMAISRSGSVDVYYRRLSSSTNSPAGDGPIVFSVEDDLDDATKSSFESRTITGKTVMKGTLVYVTKEVLPPGTSTYECSVVEIDTARGTSRKLVTNSTSAGASDREIFLGTANKNEAQSAGSSDVFACYLYTGSTYRLKNLSLEGSSHASVTLSVGVTVTSMWVARPLGGVAGPTTSGRVYLGLSDGTIQEWDGNVEPPAFVRTLTASGGGNPINAMIAAAFGANEWLWAMDAAGVLDRWDIVTNTLTTSLSTSVSLIRDITLTDPRYLVFISTNVVGRVANPTSTPMTLQSTVSPTYWGDLTSVNFTGLAAYGTQVYITDSTNGCYWSLSASSTLVWPDGNLLNSGKLFDINNLVEWKKPQIDLSDRDQVIGELPMGSVSGTDRVGGAYLASKPFALTPGTTLQVVLGAAPTLMCRVNYDGSGFSSKNFYAILRPGAKDIAITDLNAGLTYTTEGLTIPLTGANYAPSGGKLQGYEITISAIWALASATAGPLYAIDLTNLRLLAFDMSESGNNKVLTGNPRVVKSVTNIFNGINPPGLMAINASDPNSFFMVVGTRVTLVKSASRRREQIVWQSTLTIPSLGGNITSIVSASTFLFVATDQGEVHKYNNSNGAFVATISSSETGSPITKLATDGTRVYWVTDGVQKQFNRVLASGTTIDGTGTTTVGVTAVDVAVGSGKFAILKTDGVVFLQDFATGSPSVVTFAPDNTTTIVGATTLSNIVYGSGLSSGYFYVTDSGGDQIFEVQPTIAMPVAIPLGGVVQFI